MIVDTSAVVAILKSEPERDAMLNSMSDVAPKMSAASYLEAAIVIDGLGDPVKSRRLDELLTTLGVEIVPVTAEQARIARRAHQDYGRGGGHPARLNFGDTLSYALAVENREPLLFNGDDFGHTDVSVALPS